MSLENTKMFFDIALPEKTLETRCVQIGCHFEEVAEMMEALGLNANAEKMHELANKFKRKINGAMVQTKKADLVKLADAMGDQIVTATGVMENFNMDSLGIVNNISDSNLSKFEDGKPVFDSNGKITKGKDYVKPNLEEFV